MRTSWRLWVASALLATVAGSAAMPGVSRAAGRPDLKIELGGYWDPSDTRGLLFRVTNVGDAKASAAKAHVQTLAPVAGNVKEPEYPALEPGKSFAFKYELAAPCDGHVVKAGVSATSDGEINLDNNFFQGPACPPKLPPAPKPESKPVGGVVTRSSGPIRADDGRATTDMLDTELVQLPEHLRPGDQTRELEPSVFQVHALRRKNCGISPIQCALEPPPDSPTHVGLSSWDNAGADVNRVYQLVLNFDLEWLRDVEKKQVTRAELLFEERVHLARDRDGNAISTLDVRCSGKLGLAPSNWPEIVKRTSGTDSLIPELLATTPVEGDRVGGGWDVTRDVRWASSRNNPPLDGFVLHSVREDLDAEDDLACLSLIESVHLRLEYTVLR